MLHVGSFDAKTHLPALLQRVAKGETVQITNRGNPVAMLVPVPPTQKHNPKEAAEQIRKLRKGLSLGNVSLRELIDEGRP